MGKKVSAKNDGEAAAVAVGGESEEVGPITVVLRLDLHCDGCAKKVRRSVSKLKGVEKVNADRDGKKLTVTGHVDPAWLREKVQDKTKKKVDLVSPQQPGKEGAAAGGVKKPKEDVVSTVVMEIKLHCEGCADKIKRLIFKNIGGVTSVQTEFQKGLVTVVGKMDAKELVPYLREKLKGDVEIVLPKKNDMGEKKTKKVSDDRGGDEKKRNVSGDGNVKKEKGGIDNNGNEEIEKKKDEGNCNVDEKQKGKKKDGGNDIVDEKQRSKSRNEKIEKNKDGWNGRVIEKKKDGWNGRVDEKQKSKSENNKEKDNSEVQDGMNDEMGKMEQHSYDLPTMYDLSYIGQDYGTLIYHNQGYSDKLLLPPHMYSSGSDGMFSDENPNGCFIM